MSRLTPALASLLVIVAGCASLPTIATNVTYCCSDIVVQTVSVEFADTPEFLKPMLRDEAAIVLNGKGIEYTEGEADAILHMTYIDKTLERGSEELEAWERIAPGGGVRFIAEVRMQMTHSASGDVLWSGTMQRIHNVYEGSYMHDAPARAAMRNAFLEMFAGLTAAGEATIQ